MIREVVVPEEVVVKRSLLEDKLAEGVGGAHDPAAVRLMT